MCKIWFLTTDENIAYFEGDAAQNRGLREK
jgi:hypothetical protein